MKITISGLPGSGTTTVSRLLSKKFKLKYIYAGEIFRRMAKKKKMSLEEFSRLAEKNLNFDKKVDKIIIKFAKKYKNILLEGRMSAWMTKKEKIKAFRIWIDAPFEIRVKRISQRDNIDFNQARRLVSFRQKSEAKRYKDCYGIDISDLSVYDLIVDSNKMLPGEIVEFISKKMKK